MKLDIPRETGDRLKLVADKRSKETGRRLSAHALARAVLAEYANQKLKALRGPR